MRDQFCCGPLPFKKQESDSYFIFQATPDVLAGHVQPVCLGCWVSYFILVVLQILFINFRLSKRRKEGYIHIVLAISLVLTNVQGFLAVKMPIEYCLRSLKEQLHHIREQMASCRQISAVFPHGPLQLERSSGGRSKYQITAEQINVLRSTRMSWTAIAKC